MNDYIHVNPKIDFHQMNYGREGTPVGPRWLRINGREINCAEKADRQRDEVIVAIASSAYAVGYAAAINRIRSQLGLPHTAVVLS